MPNRPVCEYWKQYAHPNGGLKPKIKRNVAINLYTAYLHLDDKKCIPYCHLEHILTKMNIRGEGRVVYSMVDDDA